MTHSPSAIADELMAIAGSILGDNAVSKSSYQVMETAAYAACIITYTHARGGTEVFGNDAANKLLWNFSLRLYLRDTGDPEALLNRTFTVPVQLLTAIAADATIHGTAFDITEFNLANSPGEVYTNNSGATWLLLPISLSVVTWD
jgi:hypothetical protein